MGKSKKKNRQNDARGYVQQQKASVPPTQSGGSVVSKETHDGIQSLVGKLQIDQSKSIVSQSFSPIIVDSRFTTKLTSIVQQLLELGFTTSQLERLARNIDSWTLESALDWFCLNLSTLELPPLFTDGLVRESLRAAAKSDATGKIGDALTVVRFFSHDRRSGDREETQRRLELLPSPGSDIKSLAQQDNLTQGKDKGDEYVKNEDEEARERNERKAKILQQYECYCSDEEENGSENFDTLADTDTEKVVPEDTVLRHLSPVEEEFNQKERELLDLEADLGNEANNYMRSKQETKQLQQEAKQLRKHVAALKRKIEREKRQYEKKDELQMQQQHQTEDAFEVVDDDEGYGDFFGGGLFDKTNEEDQNDAESLPASNVVSPPEGRPVLDAQIPPGWTGTTPRKKLEEVFRKRKLGAPKFSKLSARQGFKLLLPSSKRTSKDAMELTALEKDFTPGSSLEDYLSMKALYDMETSMPLYRMFPPSFRDLWLSWLERDNKQKQEVLEEHRAEHDEFINRLLTIVKEQKGNKLEGVQDDASTQDQQTSNPDVRAVEDSWENVLERGDDLKPTLVMPNRQAVEGRQLQEEFSKRQRSPFYREMLKQRESLPMAAYRDSILEMVRKHPVTIVCADTGAGKTTQCPQYLLEEALLSGKGDCINIICTQPRRVAATSIAERVADEMKEKLGNQVGYQIRMESKKSAKTKLLFCTTGVLLRRLQDDRNLRHITHVVCDEVHERQVQTDVLLISLKQLLSTTRPDLKVILMSATMDPALFANFFNGAPVLQVPGRTFPVANFFLEDVLEATGHIIEEDSQYAKRHYNRTEKTTIWVTTKGGEKRREVVDLEAANAGVSDEYVSYSMTTRMSMERVDEKVLNFDLIEDVLQLLLLNSESNTLLCAPEGANTKSGAVLIFLPGIGEIRSLYDRLTSNRRLGDASKFLFIPLHSKLSSADQRKAFLPSNKGEWKIVLATNIAETSLTIPDVVVVIDSGKEREVRRNKRTSTSILVNDWCSKASARQRAGRAGRVQPGLCVKLFSSKTAHAMKATSEPELKRVPLEEVCLSILASGMGRSCHNFLDEAPQPPNSASVQAALSVLKDVGAITREDEALTPLGQHLARLPVDARIGKMLVFGSLFKCLDRVLTIAAALSSKSPFESFIRNNADEKAKHRQFQDADSDFITLCNVFEAFNGIHTESSKQARSFCKSNYLSQSALRDISMMRRDFLDLLCGIGFVSKGEKDVFNSQAWHTSPINENASNLKIVHAIICAGLWPNVAVLARASPGEQTLLQRGHELFFHKTSVNASKKRFSEAESFVCYFERFGTATRESVSTTCFVSAIPLILFGGEIEVKHKERKVVVDGWMEIEMVAQTGALLRELRSRLDVHLRALIDDMKQNVKNDTILQNIAEIL